MFSIEIRVNGQLVKTLTGIRTSTLLIDNNVGEYKMHTHDLQIHTVKTKTLHHVI